jgi:CHAD domain-containing protein/CYTH domain-containing protein
VARRPSGLLELPAYEGAIHIARFYLDRAGQAVRRLEKRGDDEALHDFRVSLRRLRTNLQAWEPYLATAVSTKLRRRIRDLAASTGSGRDVEVHLVWLDAQSADLSLAEKAGFEWLRSELETLREDGYARAVEQATTRFRKLDRRLRKRLARLEMAALGGGLNEGARFAEAVEHVLPDYAQRLDTLLSRVHSPGDVREGHRARIRAKHLRYVLEPIADDVADASRLVTRLQELQDLLGDLHDAQLLSAFVADLGRPANDPARTDARAGLARISGWLARDQATLFQRLRETWLGDRSAEFFADIEDLREELGSKDASEVEIERKYLLTGLPPFLVDRSSREIAQGYLPGSRLQERVRRVRWEGEEWYVRTVKVGSGIRRVELQEDADRSLFEVLWPLTSGRRVAKRRYRVPEAGLIWEIDEFTDRELVLAEVELPSEDVAPEVPEWLEPYVVREVTGDAEYINVNLAC